MLYLFIKMKKAISIVLLGIFLFNTTGYYVFFKIAQIEIKKEIKKEIKLSLQNDELTVITFLNSNINTIHWIENNKEFIYHNQMFDIVKSSTIMKQHFIVLTINRKRNYFKISKYKY